MELCEFVDMPKGIVILAELDLYGDTVLDEKHVSTGLTPCHVVP